MAEDQPAEAAPELAPEEMNAAPDQEQALDSTYEQVGVPYGAQSTSRKGNGFVGAPPSSLAALANGRKYLSDPLTPVTPRPNRGLIRSSTTGPPLATGRSNHWVTQTSQGYAPVRLQNHRIPKTPIEVRIGFPAKPQPTSRWVDGSPSYMVDDKGHLLPQYRKPGRSAFPEVPQTGQASWAFRRVGYV